MKFENIDLKEYRKIEVINYFNVTRYNALNLLIILSLHELINIVAYVKQYCSNN